jgi:hypothetical protein
MSEPQEQGSEQLGGLLDAEAQRQAEQQGDQGEQQQTAPTVESLQAQLTDMQSQFQSEVDRRVNQVVSTLRSEMARAQQAPPPQQQGAPPPQQQVSGGQSTSADLREARMVYREFVNESVKFLGPEERALAADLSAAQLQQAVTGGMDPDTAGRHVAAEVSKRIKDARGMYETSVVNALRRTGQLQERTDAVGSSVRYGQQVSAGGKPDAGSSYAKGAAMAKEIGRGKPPAG